MDLSSSFLSHFQSLDDPRLDNHNRRHELQDMLVMSILGTISGCDNWVEICAFAESNKTWLKSFLKLPHGIPSHDTMGRVFSLLNAEEFERCFCDWVSSLSVEGDKIIAIDGKTLRGSHRRDEGQKPLHLVSAWATGQGLMLGQVKTADKSNEIEAIPRLLKMVDIKDSVVTIDAMGCQKTIAESILHQQADYVLSLKDNQKTLHQDVISIFKQGVDNQFKGMLNRRVKEKVRAHGRVETRRYSLISARDKLPFQLRWPGLQSIGMLEVTRTVKKEVIRSTRYFLTSLPYEKIDLFSQAARKHWDIEINLHWSLDVSFHEDLNRVRTGDGAENLAIVRRIALNLLKQEKSKKVGIACKRKTAGWDRDYLLKVLMADKKLIA